MDIVELVKSDPLKKVQWNLAITSLLVLANSELAERKLMFRDTTILPFGYFLRIILR